MQIVTLTNKGRMLARSINPNENERAVIVSTLDFNHGSMTSDQIHELVGDNSGLFIRSLIRDGIVIVT
jgi:hypothetical protein